MKKLLLLVPALFLGFASLPASADEAPCFINCTTEVYETYEVTENITNEHYTIGISESDWEESIAAAMAVSSLQFDFSDSALQVSVGGGWYEGENAAAIGVAKRFGQSLLINASGTVVADKNAGGVGATWRF